MDYKTARFYIKPDTEAYYLSDNMQCTILLSENYDCDVKDVLNDEGQKLLNYVEEKVKNNEFNGTFKNPQIHSYRSGSWFNDEKSKFYDEKRYNILCCHNNRILSGELVGSETQIKCSPNIQTSPLIFFNNRWVYTLSGSLYRIDGEIKNADNARFYGYFF